MKILSLSRCIFGVQGVSTFLREGEEVIFITLKNYDSSFKSHSSKN